VYVTEEKIKNEYKILVGYPNQNFVATLRKAYMRG
jgi:hypothetical protein